MDKWESPEEYFHAVYMAQRYGIVDDRLTPRPSYNIIAKIGRHGDGLLNFEDSSWVDWDWMHRGLNTVEIWRRDG